MLRIIFAVFALAAVTSTAVSAQPLPPEWASWLGKNEPQVSVKQAGIDFWSTYQSQVCRIQNTKDKKLDCSTKVGVILSGLKFEKSQLSGMVDAFHKLPADEGIALAFTVNPDYQRRDAETTNLSREVLDLYPQRQAAAEKK